MGLPSGTLWAISDIDVTKENGFADTPFTYEKSFFSWGNVDGHNPTSENSFSPWNWGSVNENEPYYEGQVYGDTPGNTLTGNIPENVNFDASRANLGTPWRMPTSEEYEELFNNIIFINADGTEVDTEQTDKRVIVNGILGLYIESRLNSERLFFSCSGYGLGMSRSRRATGGYYWSSTWINAHNAHGMDFSSAGVNMQNNSNRYYGFAIRAVRDGNS